MTRYAKHISLIVYHLTLLVILSACSTTKLVPDDDKLFIGLEAINYENYEKNDHFTETQEELEAALATQPNGALFGSSYYRTPFPYGLWIWNYAYGSSGKIKKWLIKSFGKAPVLMSKVNPELRASVAKSVLQKNGYMHGNVTFYEVPHSPSTPSPMSTSLRRCRPSSTPPSARQRLPRTHPSAWATCRPSVAD